MTSVGRRRKSCSASSVFSLARERPPQPTLGLAHQQAEILILLLRGVDVALGIAVGVRRGCGSGRRGRNQPQLRQDGHRHLQPVRLQTERL